MPAELHFVPNHGTFTLRTETGTFTIDQDAGTVIVAIDGEPVEPLARIVALHEARVGARMYMIREPLASGGCARWLLSSTVVSISAVAA